jgi:hypothetical protein
LEEEGEDSASNLEEALDLALLIPFSPISGKNKRRLLPY